MTIFACVLKSGGDYGLEDVLKLRDRVLQHAGNYRNVRFVCFSDLDVSEHCERVHLEHNWPGWWSKKELFNPAFKGALTYLDLDTVPVGDLSGLAAVKGPAIMRDVYRPDGLQSAIMVIPQDKKSSIWRYFLSDPERHMRECTVRYTKWGDQGFLEGHWQDAKRLQDVLPGQIVSWKANECAARGIPAEARLVVFHGKPRPRDVGY
jgi:hypothetical protein